MARFGFYLFRKSLFPLVLALPFMSPAQAVVNWTGATSTAWSAAGNWSTGVVPDTSSAVQIGITPYTNQPVISANTSIASLTFGGPKAVSLTINTGDTLRISGSIIQGHTGDDQPPSTVLQGTGSIVCGSVIAGNNVLPKLVLVQTTQLISRIASLTVTGNIAVNSTTTDLLSGGFGYNNSLFTLERGTLTLGGKITLDNFYPAYLDSLPGKKPLSKFMIQTDSAVNATLILSDSSALSMAHTGYDSVDFYRPGSTGRSVVRYSGNNQLFFTNNQAGLDTLPYTYQDASIATAGRKTAGVGSTSNHVTIGGDLRILTGDLDLQSFGAATTVYGNFVNHDTINVGTPGIVFKGASFINSKAFNYNDGMVTFSGATQNLTDSTTTGSTNLRRVTFSDTGTKHIQHGVFAIIPSGRVNLANNVTVQVDSAGTFILRSDSTSTAAITPIPSGSVITGIVNAEWFVQGSWVDLTRRAYRSLSSPVNHTGNTNGTGDYNIVWLNGTTNYDGAIITGPSGSTNGFYNPAGNPTVYLNREDVSSSGSSFTSGNYKGMNKINNTDLNDIGTQKRFTTTAVPDTTIRLHIGNAVLFFFRGNKVSPNGTTAGTKTTTPYNYPESVTFTNKGTVNQGQVQVRLYYRNNDYLSYTDSSYISNAGARGFNFVGNPYPSPINWDNFSSTDSTASIYGPGLSDTIQIIHPSQPQTPPYDYYVADPSHDRNQVYSGTGSATNVLAAGQGFFVKVSASSPNKLTASLRFREAAKFNPPDTSTMMSMMLARAVASPAATRTAKATGSHQAKKQTAKPVRTGISRSYIRLKLAQGKQEAELLISFSSAKIIAAPAMQLADPDIKDTGSALSLFSYSTANRLPVANSYKLPARSQTISLHANAAISGSYNLEMSELRNIPVIYRIILKDKLNGRSTDLRKQRKYSFQVDKTNKSSYGDRFELLIAKTVK